MNWKEAFEADLNRYGCNKPKKWSWTYNFLYFLRRSNNCNNKILLYYYKLMFNILRNKRGIEIYKGTKIGKGLYIGHPYNITINPTAILGININIHKGVTIGQENRGIRKGTPIIGNEVWIGVNATIVGKIKIGNDVLIAPNTFVNCDIPSHSVVFGNPCQIVKKANATCAYINNLVDM